MGELQEYAKSGESWRFETIASRLDEFYPRIREEVLQELDLPQADLAKVKRIIKETEAELGREFLQIARQSFRITTTAFFEMLRKEAAEKGKGFDEFVRELAR